MYLYLIRHGIAVDMDTIDPDLHICDQTRPLTRIGRKRTEKVAEHLAISRLSFDIIITSPLLRAEQTAKILIEHHLSSKLLLCDDLAPEGILRSWLTWWESQPIYTQTTNLALVGHEPNLSEWAELLIFGSIQHKLILKKGGIIGLKFPEGRIAVGTAQLHCLIPPKYLVLTKE